jgi:ParB-like chromosome segregation protein Spo0J
MLIRDRIKELRRVPVGELRPNPRNWRTHPDAQRDALRAVLAEVGYADALVARELEDGSLELVDGHLRAETTPEAVAPVLVLDVTAAEADKLLLTLDPLAALAGVDEQALAELRAATHFDSPTLNELLDGLTADATSAENDEAYASERPEVEIPESWELVVECTGEDDQRDLYRRMRDEGRRCRVVAL